MNTIEEKAANVLAIALATFGYYFGYLMAGIVLYDALELYLGWAQPTFGDLLFYAVMFAGLQFMRATERGMEADR